MNKEITKFIGASHADKIYRFMLILPNSWMGLNNDGQIDHVW